MPRPFSPTRALGIPPKAYDSYFDEEPVGSGSTFSPDKGYSARGAMVTPTDAFSEQFGQFAAQSDLATLDAQRDLLSGKSDLLSPEGRGKRLDYMLKGVISPQQERAIQYFEQEPRVAPVNKYSPVPADVVRAAAPLLSINPASPTAWEDITKILSQIQSDPEYGNSNVVAHPFFQEHLREAKRNALAASTHRDTVARSDSRKNALSALESRQLQLASEEIPELTDDRKRSSFIAAYGREPKSQEDWSIAFSLGERELEPQRRILGQIVQDLESSGKQVPSRYKSSAGLLEGGSPPDAPLSGEPPKVTSPVEQRVRVTTQAQYDSLPSGAKAIDSKGRPFTKK